MCGDCIAATFIVCFGCCYGRRVGSITNPVNDDQVDNPRPANRLTKQRTIDHLAQKTNLAKKQKKPRVSPTQAHERLLSDLSQPLTSDQTTALPRLKSAFTLPKPYLTPALLTSLIPDLNTVLFANHLKDRLKIEWANLSVTPNRLLRGISLPYDFRGAGITKVKIRLNIAILELDSKEEIWGTVVHEMLHAYLDVRCGWGGLLVPHHGPLFERSCEALALKLGVERFKGEHVV